MCELYMCVGCAAVAVVCRLSLVGSDCAYVFQIVAHNLSCAHHQPHFEAMAIHKDSMLVVECPQTPDGSVLEKLLGTYFYESFSAQTKVVVKRLRDRHGADTVEHVSLFWSSDRMWHDIGSSSLHTPENVWVFVDMSFCVLGFAQDEPASMHPPKSGWMVVLTDQVTGELFWQEAPLCARSADPLRRGAPQWASGDDGEHVAKKARLDRMTRWSEERSLKRGGVKSEVETPTRGGVKSEVVDASTGATASTTPTAATTQMRPIGTPPPPIGSALPPAPPPPPAVATSAKKPAPPVKPPPAAKLTPHQPQGKPPQHLWKAATVANAKAVTKPRGGWFNRCQRLCEAVLHKDHEEAHRLAQENYAGPEIFEEFVSSRADPA